MPSASLHLTHAELLTQEPALDPLFRLAMQQEIPFARLGAVFHDLPFYTNIVTMMLGYWLERPAEQCPFAQRLHQEQPDQFAWHFLCEAQKEHALSRDQRFALLGGFLAHVALDLELHPLVNWCARRDTVRLGGNESHHHRLNEKYHSLFFHKELYGHDIIGRPRFFLEKAKIVDPAPFVRLNADHPFYNWAAQVASGFFQKDAPTSRQFAIWVRSFRHFSLMVSLPIAYENSQRLGNEENRRHYYENDEFSFREFWQRGYQRSLSLLNLAAEVIAQQRLDTTTKQSFLEQAQIADLSYPPEHHLPDSAPGELPGPGASAQLASVAIDRATPSSGGRGGNHAAHVVAPAGGIQAAPVSAGAPE